MKKQEIDTSFINFLQIPTIILTFDGEIVNTNDATFQISDASSKIEYFQANIRDLLFDSGKMKILMNRLKCGDDVIISRTILKTFKSNITFRTLILRVLPNDPNLILGFNYGIMDGNLYLFNRIDEILKQANQLIPFMSKKGVDTLKKIIDSNNSSAELEFERGLAHILAREINKSFPMLSKTEQYICALLTLGYTSKEIEFISSFSLNKIRVNISRASKKLNIETRVDLIDKFKPFVKNIYEL